MKLPSWHRIGQSLGDHRQLLLTCLVAAELLILLILLARWFDRRYGLRGTIRRGRRFVVAVCRDLVAPITRAIRFRRGVQVIAVRVAAGDPVATARAAFAAATVALTAPRRRALAAAPVPPAAAFAPASALAVSASAVSASAPAAFASIAAPSEGPTTPSGGGEGRGEASSESVVDSVAVSRDSGPARWPYLVLLGAAEATVGLAGPGEPPAPDPRFWRVTAPRRWTTALPPPVTDPSVTAGDCVPLIFGVRGEDLVLLDIARSPGVVSVHGARGPVDRLMATLAAQLGTLETGGTIERLIVAGETVPDAIPAGGRTVLVVSRPGPEAAARIVDLVTADGDLVVLVGGYVPGSRWRLRVDTTGRVTSPELGVDADSSPLSNGLTLAETMPGGPRRLVAALPSWATEKPAAGSALALPNQNALPPEPGMPVPVPQAVSAAAGPPSDDLIEPASAEARPMAHSDAARTGGDH